MTDKETVEPDIYERANEEARHGNREALEAAAQPSVEGAIANALERYIFHDVGFWKVEALGIFEVLEDKSMDPCQTIAALRALAGGQADE